MKICELWLLITERMAVVHGAPLPKEMLTLGNENQGWFARLNNTAGEVDNLAQFAIAVQWNGWPAGIIDPHGGVIAAGDAANEDTLREWIGGAL